MIEAKSLVAEANERENSKDRKRYNFLYHFEFDERKRSTIVAKTYAVGRYLAAILKERNAPAYQDYAQHPELLEAFHFAKLQVTIPRHGHEAVAHYQEQNSVKSFHLSQKQKVAAPRGGNSLCISCLFV